MINLENTKKIYFIGIGGIGMSALAGIAKAKGFEVAGSDSNDIYDPSKAVLDKYGIKYHIGFDLKNIVDFNLSTNDLMVVGAATDKDNPELKYAQEQNFKIAGYPELLGVLVSDKKRIVVVGTHGKGTTSGLISFALKGLEDSGFFVGAVLTDIKTNFYYGSGKYFVIEGDEYRSGIDDQKPKFAYYNPDFLLINNIEFDHPDIYKDLDAFKKPFIDLVSGMNEETTIIYNADDLNVLDVISHTKAKKIPFSLTEQKNYKLPGKPYAYDYLAAKTTLETLGFNFQDFEQYFKDYTGVKRRYETIYDGNITIIDDYAHHPTAVRETLEATKEKYPNRRIVCFFEPHTYSRTKETLSDLERAFNSADLAYIAEVYPAREQKLESSITGQDVVNKVVEFNKNTYFVLDKQDALSKYRQQKKDGDVVIVMAVGSFNTLVDDLKKEFGA
ncbi:MAG: UDP-N-acetylmuramate--L-alanine ligase [Candidatus Doudnabacteria bacterium]